MAAAANAGRAVAVATSGGRDSTALLHCTTLQARLLGLRVVALHVHHGLVPEADDWLQQVRRQARRWGAEFEASRLQGGPGAGESVEAWARRERYQALAAMAHAQGCTAVLLAHHRRDQAETWLLQALRGGGAAGLAAMPRAVQRQNLWWCRPWLDQARPAIDAYLRRHRLTWVEDSSNDEPRFARNRLRQAVWPALVQAFPDAETVLSAAARQAQVAQELSQEVAELDLPPLLQGESLNLARWQALPRARRLNALQAWLHQVLDRAAPASLLQRLARELPADLSSTADQTASWSAPGGELHLYRGQLGWSPSTAAGAAISPNLQASTLQPSHQPLDLSRPGRYTLPGWGGAFVVRRMHQAATEEQVETGATPSLLQGLSCAARQGGERLALQPHARARSLKKQYQAAGVPAWLRQGPLLWTADGRLLFVPGLGLDARLRAAPGQSQLALQWLPDEVGGQPSARDKASR